MNQPLNPVMPIVREALSKPHAKDAESLTNAIIGIGAGVAELNRFFAGAALPIPDPQPGGTGKNNLWEMCRHHVLHASNSIMGTDLSFADAAIKTRAMQSAQSHIEQSLPYFEALRAHVTTLPAESFPSQSKVLKYLDATKLAGRALAQRAGRVAIGLPARTSGDVELGS